MCSALSSSSLPNYANFPTPNRSIKPASTLRKCPTTLATKGIWLQIHVTVSKGWKNHRAQPPYLLNYLSRPPLLFGELPNLGGRQGPSSFMEGYHRSLGTRPRLGQLDTLNEDSVSGKVALEKHLQEELVRPGARKSQTPAPESSRLVAGKPLAVTTCLLS